MATVEVTFTPLPVNVRTARLIATAVARRSGVAGSLLDDFDPEVSGRFTELARKRWDVRLQAEVTGVRRRGDQIEVAVSGGRRLPASWKTVSKVSAALLTTKSSRHWHSRS